MPTVIIPTPTRIYQDQVALIDLQTRSDQVPISWLETARAGDTFQGFQINFRSVTYGNETGCNPGIPPTREPRLQLYAGRHLARFVQRTSFQV